MSESRQQRRASKREPLIVVARIVVYTTTGRAIEMDPDKIDIIARDTGKPLFSHVQEGEVVTRPQLVQNGDLTGLRAPISGIVSNNMKGPNT
jgi:hypothetical protein